MAKLNVTNEGDVAVRFFDGENQIDVPAGASANISVKSNCLVIDMTPTSEATMDSFRKWQEGGELGAG